MSPVAVAAKDAEAGPSPCCEGFVLRISKPCGDVAYCEKCDRWYGDPKVTPVSTGPTWKRDEQGRFIRPKHSLGPAVVRWVHKYVQNPDGSPWVFTPEQTRLLFWMYAIDDDGRWLFREMNIQRMKGWGKDPFLAVVCLVELIGPCRFAGWNPDGTPRAKECEDAWVTIAAVSKAQTRNTMAVFPGIVSPAMKREYGVVVGKEQVVALAGKRTILAVTSSPTTLEGNRPTFSVGNEPHHWRENNDGYAMRDVMDRNTAKSRGGQSRICWITNAYNPAEMSVGQLNRESWEMAERGDTIATSVLYDSLEAPESARLVPREIPVVLEAVRGDAVWLDIPSLTSVILDPRNAPSTSRRFYYNQITADSETWVDPKAVDATVNEQVREWRSDPDIETDSLRVGWALVAPDEPVVVFFDGGKSDDHTAISGCRLSDGYTFAIGFWGKPKTWDDKAMGLWRAPRTDVDDRMVEVMRRFKVYAVWGDPSHARDDEDDEPYWLELLNTWHRRWKADLLFWAVKTGDGQHAVMWDMTSPARQAMFVPAAEEFVRAMEAKEFTHDGHPMFVRYMKNARRLPTKWGTSLWKGARGSQRKIDGAVTHVGARMLRDLVLNKGVEVKPKGGSVWGAW